MPIAVTSPMPEPRTIKEPGKHARQVIAAGAMRLEGAPGAAAILRTGTDSPVSRDSSVWRSWLSTSTASAGTRSPSASTIKSPRTTSRPAMRLRSPSRMTRARGLVRSRSASRTRSVRLSCTTVMATDRSREHEQDDGFLQVAEQRDRSGRRRAAAPASARGRTSTIMRNGVRRSGRGSSLYPSAFSLA